MLFLRINKPLVHYTELDYDHMKRIRVSTYEFFLNDNEWHSLYEDIILENRIYKKSWTTLSLVNKQWYNTLKPFKPFVLNMPRAMTLNIGWSSKLNNKVIRRHAKLLIDYYEEIFKCQKVYQLPSYLST